MLKETLQLPGGHQSHARYKLDERGRLIHEPQSQTNEVSLVQQIRNKLSSILLPIGYPASVTSEYMEFQLYDTIW